MSLDAHNYPVNIDVPENAAETFKLKSFLKNLHRRARFENSMLTCILPGMSACHPRREIWASKADRTIWRVGGIYKSGILDVEAKNEGTLREQ
jgi:hypothetical protein